MSSTMLTAAAAAGADPAGAFTSCVMVLPAPTVLTVKVVAKLLPPNKPAPMVSVLPTV